MQVFISYVQKQTYLITFKWNNILSCKLTSKPPPPSPVYIWISELGQTLQSYFGLYCTVLDCTANLQIHECESWIHIFDSDLSLFVLLCSIKPHNNWSDQAQFFCAISLKVWGCSNFMINENKFVHEGIEYPSSMRVLNIPNDSQVYRPFSLE